MESLTTKTKETVEAYLNNMASKNYQANASLFADNVEWRIPGNKAKAPWIRDRNTKAEAVGFYEELFRYVEGISFEITGKFYDGDQAVVTGHLVSRMLSTGKLFDSLFTIQVTVTDGLITRYILLEDSYNLVEALTA
ncbi:nuclear transport factor 2 family protein [Chitinophaga varians]|uniref:Nuclear transport factor 2 family protein n=1 Tax=Chitinophaga varians TaxID=2202339 RepID=A0A847S3V6_9BACT|nr:nuclear transport factor 2 family protein [Chitinophaga varians]NLR69134.1 nuclear transport factor 2 family protein [Chitinophaga varians]